MENKKGDRGVRKERSFVQAGEGRGGQQHHQHHQHQQADPAAMKKERSFVRHSHHQQYQHSNANNNNNNNNNNNSHHHHHHQNARDGRSHPGGLSRQRSFVRHNSSQQARDQTRRRSAMPATNRSKPAMELYRPPTLRGPGIFDNANGDAVYNGKVASNGGYHESKSGLNVNAREFVSVTTTRPPLQHSKSSSSVPLQGRPDGLQHSKSGSNLRQSSNGEVRPPSGSPPRVHFSDDKENDPQLKFSRPPSLAVGVLSQPGIKRSKSLGSADLRATQLLEASTPPAAMPDLGPFSPDVQGAITKAMTDPNSVSARQLMEVVRHVFTRVVEASRHAEPAARLCISIIEKEKNETFLETLLNTCQEYFQERDRLLRNNPPAPYPGFVPAHPRWIAYMTFLNEMYTQLKRRHVQLMTKRMRNSETPAGLLLLTLLSQCCQVCLKENSVNSLAETECLFFVLTGLGKDIEVELPHQMAKVMGAARDAFLTTVRVPAVRKTLLQLIEMHAARWQLPAPAVMYYYPGSGSK
ncbi:CBP80/20-dependent translation initiation factor-like isoform X3 [Penaeus monodon]|uniref:CBP80/20-dependent translation initiation factor-like isoform X3 n=1 Tax=Penaeus monodon TaxID=6687 RepID=UPI0018A727FB|nr:CBP80/20-dependent translation initiation factor-like isoform X3 [Penaeus monodon]XP_037796447.1 CBP80/20-dependent translation initiation factor-like isoform X3 [Penaeus monodon]